ncbi:MAG: sel1 repeat family protein [Lentisphaerae bacterium]|nr:sel1 repeat family protein [Lentisphaerota bacterium]
MRKFLMLFIMLLLGVYVFAAADSDEAGSEDNKADNSGDNEFSFESDEKTDMLVFNSKTHKYHVQLLKDSELPECVKAACIFRIPRLTALPVAKLPEYTTVKPKSPKQISWVQCEKLLQKFKDDFSSFIFGEGKSDKEVMASVRALNNAMGVTFIEEEAAAAVMLLHEVGINWGELKKRAAKLKNLRIPEWNSAQHAHKLKTFRRFFSRVEYAKFDGGNVVAIRKFAALRYMMDGVDFGFVCTGCNFIGGCTNCTSNWMREFTIPKSHYGTIVEKKDGDVEVPIPQDPSSIHICRPCECKGGAAVCSICGGIGKVMVTKKMTHYYMNNVAAFMRLDITSAWKNYALAMSAYEHAGKNKKALASARRYLMSAVSGKLPLAYLEYAKFLEKGIGGPKNQRLANVYWKRAAERKVLEAILHMAKTAYAEKRYADARPWIQRAEPHRRADVLTQIAWMVANLDSKHNAVVYPYYKKAGDLAGKEALVWCEKYCNMLEYNDKVTLFGSEGIMIPRWALPITYHNRAVYCKVCFTTGLKPEMVGGRIFDVLCDVCHGWGRVVLPVTAVKSADALRAVPQRKFRLSNKYFIECKDSMFGHMLCPKCKGEAYFINDKGVRVNCEYCNDEDGISAFKILKKEDLKKASEPAPAADGSTPAVDGSTPPADGSTPPADGSTPPADGAAPPPVPAA